MIVLPFPSPTNIKLIFFLPTLRLFSSYLPKEKTEDSKTYNAIINPFPYTRGYFHHFHGRNSLKLHKHNREKIEMEGIKT